MSLNPNGAVNYSWNYSKSDRDDYSLELWGTVVSLQEVQAREYNPGGQPGRPRFWSDNKPVMNIRIGFATPDGTLKTITFQKAGKAQREGTKPSLHMQLFNLSGGDMELLKGKTLHLWTWPTNPNTGATWGQGNPRLFGVEEVTDTSYELAMPLPSEYTVEKLFADDAVSGGQMQGAPQMNGQFYAAPTAQPQQYQPQPQQYQQPRPQANPMLQRQRDYYDGYYGAPQPAYQPQPQQPMYLQQPAYSAPMPGGMDPVVAQAMRSVGATNMQPYYDDDVPFN